MRYADINTNHLFVRFNMKLKDILNEDASSGAVSAGDAAGFKGSLFKGGIIQWKQPYPTKEIGNTNAVTFPNKKKKKAHPKLVAGVPIINYDNN